MEASKSSKSWASLLGPIINRPEKNIIFSKKNRKGFRGKSRKSNNFNNQSETDRKFDQKFDVINNSKIHIVEMSPRERNLTPVDQMMQNVDHMVQSKIKKILKLSDVQINQKLDLNRHDLNGLPKNLVNRSNFCWINSMLQILFATVPILKLIQNIQKSGLDIQSTCPTLNVLVQTYSRMTNQMSQRGFEPIEMYRWFGKINPEYENGQNDAEEGLLLILNSIHDELDALRKLSEKTENRTTNNNNNINADASADLGQDGEWQTMTKSGKKVTPAKKVASQETTFISRYFGGSLTSSVRIESPTAESTPKTAKNSNNAALRGAFSTTEQPFMTLPLEISKSNDIQSALRYLSKVENVDGYQARLSHRFFKLHIA